RARSAFGAVVPSSPGEGRSVARREAMATGTPIVATAVGGNPEVVSSHEALLVPPDDPAALARAIRHVHEDPAAAAARAECARARVAREFALLPWLTRYERVYRSVL